MREVATPREVTPGRVTAHHRHSCTSLSPRPCRRFLAHSRHRRTLGFRVPRARFLRKLCPGALKSLPVWQPITRRTRFQTCTTAELSTYHVFFFFRAPFSDRLVVHAVSAYRVLRLRLVGTQLSKGSISEAPALDAVGIGSIVHARRLLVREPGRVKKCVVSGAIRASCAEGMSKQRVSGASRCKAATCRLRRAGNALSPGQVGGWVEGPPASERRPGAPACQQHRAPIGWEVRGRWQ